MLLCAEKHVLVCCLRALLTLSALRLIGDPLQITPERYMQAIAALQPDMYVALADEVRWLCNKQSLTLYVLTI
jgi:hypothetical protein